MALILKVTTAHDRAWAKCLAMPLTDKRLEGDNAVGIDKVIMRKIGRERCNNVATNAALACTLVEIEL